MREITGVLVDVYRNKAEVRTVKDCLETYYELLDCRCIDIVGRRVGAKRGFKGKAVNIVCDDEGALRDDCKISAISDLGETMLVGNLFITGLSDNGKLTNLSEKDAQYLLDRIQPMSTRKYRDPYVMLTQVGY